MTQKTRVTDGARTRDSRSHNPSSTSKHQALIQNYPRSRSRENTQTNAGTRTGCGNQTDWPELGDRIRVGCLTYTVLAVNRVARTALCWRPGLSIAAEWSVMTLVRRAPSRRAAWSRVAKGVRRAHGLCIACQRPAAPMITRCEEHAARHRADAAERRARLKAAG